MKKALIKKTGEILDVVHVSLAQLLKMNIEITLSDGKTYELEELVVGLDEIREWKIKNNLKIN